MKKTQNEETKRFTRAIRSLFRQDKKRGFNFKPWIEFLLILLVSLNIFFFFTYHRSHANEDLWVQLWNYFESETFRSLTVSLAFPMIIFVIESKFKIIEHIFQTRLEQAKREIEEQVEARKKNEEQRKEKRLQAIAMTSDVLNKINNLVSEVRVYDSKGELTINTIIARIASLSISVSELINTWLVRFPILPRGVYSLFRGYIVVMYWGAWAVAHCIQNKIGGDEKQLQESLAMIQRGIIGLAFEPIYKTLTNCMELMESIEAIHKKSTYESQDETRLRVFRSKVEDTNELEEKIMDTIRQGIERNLKNCFVESGSLYKVIKAESEVPNNNLQEESLFPQKPMSAIWLNCKQKVEEEIISEINNNLGEVMGKNRIENYAEIKNKLKKNIEDLIMSIFQLKIYEVLLNISEFRNEEILDSPRNSNETQEQKVIRSNYQALRKYIRNPDILKVDSDEYRKFFESNDYLNFRKSYFAIKETDRINIIAIDTVKRLKDMGTLMRFSSVIPFDQDSISGVQ